MGHRILFVDDEKNVLASIRRVFFDEDQLELSFANGGEEGLAHLKNNGVSVIVSDMRMPQMDGIEFLKKSREVAPDAVRMVLSAYADIDSIMQSINEGNVWRYITKPWNDNELLLSVKNAIDYHEKAMETKRLLAEVKEKNRQLADVNAMLEERVRERTVQIQERSELLQMIVENETLEKVMAKACATLSRHIAGRKAYVVVPFLKKTFGEQEIPEDLKTIGEEALANGKNRFEAKGVAVVLAKGGANLGAIVLESDERLGPLGLVESVDSFSSILTIALAQQKVVEDMPGLLDKMDNIMGAL
jgi:YesN/AraC family two-component response regulator